MSNEVQAIRFKQWLPEWDNFVFDQAQHRRKPDEYVLLFSMPAVQLRALSGVYRRQRDQTGGVGLQRLHDPKRSATIRDFVRFGHPYSSLQASTRSPDTEHLKKPGWLPTAIVVNVLTASDKRRGRRVAPNDLVKVATPTEATATLTLPYADRLDRWVPQDLEPFEVIDGQHRLWAFEEALADGTLPGDFELPVVAFSGLDIGWQAYLFWSINVSPKRINPSHAFDLFPLLRSEKWLETFSELRIYREARAQELTELLFTHAESPWRQRINMLGESVKTAPSGAGVTQAGWVRAVLSSFLAPGGKGRSARGLFCADITPTTGPLSWARPQQAAFLILLWRKIHEAVRSRKHQWVEQLLRPEGQEALVDDAEPAFSGTRTMLNQEQGVRGVLAIGNDLFFELAHREPGLFEWPTSVAAGGVTLTEDVTVALRELEQMPLAAWIIEIAQEMSSFDWRSADAPNLDEQTRLIKRAFRGSGGYVALREQLLSHIARSGGRVSQIAGELAAQKGIT